MYSFLLRLDANEAIGYGHLTRISALACELTARGHEVVFASRDRLERAHWFRPEWRLIPLEEKTDLHLLAETLQSDVIVCDLSAYDAEQLKALRGQTPLAILDDFQREALPADLLINPQMTWKDAPADTRQTILGGPRYALLRAPESNGDTGLAPQRDVLITMGGSDPANLTTRVLQALHSCAARLSLTVIVGPGFRHHDALNAVLRDSPRDAVVRQHVTDMASQMQAHSLAIAAVGVTLYELARLGVPALTVTETPEQERIAAALQQAGTLTAISAEEAGLVNLRGPGGGNPHLGGVPPNARGDGPVVLARGVLPDAKSGNRLAAEVSRLLANPEQRAAMSAAGRSLLDGKGPERVADALERLIAERKRRAAGKEAALR